MIFDKHQSMAKNSWDWRTCSPSVPHMQ